MKQLVVGMVFLWSLFPAASAAQRGGGGRGGGLPGGAISGGSFQGSGFRGPGFHGYGGIRSGYFGLPPVGPIPPLGSTGTYNRFRNYGYGWGGLGVSYPYALDGYGGPAYYDDGYQGPMIVMPEQDCGPTVFQPPPPPVRPELHEYKWPESSADTAATFALVLTDGSVRAAIAVWIQDNTLNYITPEGAGERLELHSINRENTRMANAAKHLTLSLPARNQSGLSR
jgi:hypothetical protein